MTLPRFLSAAAAEEIMLQVGVSLDRQSIASALRLVPLDGVIPPGRPGQAWVVPTNQLLNLLVVCLARRASRGTRGGGRMPVNFDRIYLDAAGYLMRNRELARMMPPSLKKAVRERQRARDSRSCWFGEAVADGDAA
jgi:hypothetical protein